MQTRIDESMKLLKQAEDQFAPDLVFACSFGAEDVVLIDLISKYAPSIQIITLDTGRLPQPTYAVMDACRAKYGINIQVYFPDASEVEQMVNEHGLNLFYLSVENRKRCCGIRKIHPLRRALQGKKAWLTGVRRQQADSRQDMVAIEDDDFFGLRKFNPLKEDHPAVGRTCSVCDQVFKVGDELTLIVTVPASPKDALNAQKGEAYTSQALSIHWECRGV